MCAGGGGRGGGGGGGGRAPIDLQQVISLLHVVLGISFIPYFSLFQALTL
mgnify:CR=1 FL=1